MNATLKCAVEEGVEYHHEKKLREFWIEPTTEELT